MVAAAVTLLVISVATLGVTGWQAVPFPVTASRVSAMAVYRPCPVASCAAYPEPSQVRGITIAALQNYLFWTRSVKEQVSATQGWNVNAIRVQIVQDRLVGASGHRPAAGYLHNVKEVVDYALHLHLNVILNAQTETTMGYSANENLPTAATFAFWRLMTRNYGHNPHVVFDL